MIDNKDNFLLNQSNKNICTKSAMDVTFWFLDLLYE